jgi:hypothetical protein
MFPFYFVLSSHSQLESLGGESITKHGKAADGLVLGCLVLQYIPMLRQETVFESDNVCRDPGCGPSDSGEPAVRNDIVAFCDNELVFVAQRIRRRTDQSKQTFASRRDVCAVLDVLRRPKAFCCSVVAFVEESVEGFENDRLVLFGCCL